MAPAKTHSGKILPDEKPFTQEEIARSSRIIMHLVRGVALGDRQVILHNIGPSLRSTTREHAHPHYEAQMLLEGAADCCTSARWQSLLPGQVTLHAPEAPHSWSGHEKQFLRLTLHFTITPAPCMRLLEQWPYQPHSFTILRTLLEDIYTRAAGWTARVAPQMTLLLSHLLTLTDWRDIEVPAFTSESPLFSQLYRYFEDHLHQPLSRRDIADYLGISERTLTRQFHRLTGSSVFMHLENMRLTRARGLLRESDTPIEVISRLVGYSSPSYFSRRFHQHVGMTPGQYREQTMTPADE